MTTYIGISNITWGLGLLVIIRITWELLFSPLRAFPGPFLARFTDLWRAIVTAQGRIDSTHTLWHRKYNSSAVRIGPNTISISDPNLIKTIYATKDAWTKSHMYRVNDVLIKGQRISNIFNTQDNVWHDKVMKPIRGFWTMTKVLEVEGLIDETLSKLTEKLDAKFANEPGDSSKVCMMNDWLGYFAWDVTANISFGQHYGFIEQERDVDNLIVDSTKGLYYFGPISQIPWVDYLLDKNPLVRIGPKPTLTGVMYAFKVVAQYQREIAQKDRTENPGGVHHYLDKYIKLKDTYPDMVDDNQIVNWLMLNVLAGGDTTSAIMRALVYHLAKTPTAYKKLTDELDSAQLSLPAPWRDINGKVPYLEAVIRETIRINPGLAMVLERVVPEGGLTLPDGRFIPAGTKVGINPHVTSRDPEVFGADVDEFNPERWITKDDARLRKMRDTADFAFGGGNRVCMGRYLAQLEICKLFATLYSLYDIKLVDPEHEWKYHNAWFVYQWDMPMIITRRR
ncbi:benzoate 4-monooxygenase cytochrome P450 [Pseudomassariella vexata]|uniref:Benzoate 4-monooxygenase cytochrome P450 n=1 Tax=Pseudomassariella vexata TaxID=1141098 RepID=A0A1Y2E2Z7_9PEZI|nr:benzoate 4-monooxygenase cytochrome P450 [Pseudomassariella vexata]ORY65879.1 benzoate 4-monooxygenase cytochrome P450 [Pseudomassariella vexata]